ncbi:MAG: phage baseplate assembly protein V [Rhodobacter sp.]|nr:phage baseplate assembly protein V [Rhodobacter sp.]MCA3459666.1 phage baseplate assembly protein V [Rhodobacter sp.]MCA3485417.1 phage baseplate assembly protein V [Rhodobacter sp.]
MTRAAAEADRMIANICQVGYVTAVDNATSRVRVRIGDLDTAWVPVLQIRSGAIRLHVMPSIGEQVEVTAPGGDMARAYVGGSIAIDGNAVAPNAASPTIDLGGGTLRVIGKLYVEGDVEVTGKIDVTGPVTCDADVVASGKSLVGHIHPESIGTFTGGPI